MVKKDCLFDTNIVIGLIANEVEITEKIKFFSGRIFLDFGVRYEYSPIVRKNKKSIKSQRKPDS
jgi:hypothetical protein